MAGLVTVGDAARVLGVDRSTLYRWEHRGIVRPLRDYRGWRFYRREDVDRLRRWREPKAAARLGPGATPGKESGGPGG